jgi:hypothetical protein
MSELTLNSLKGRLWHGYLKTWSQVHIKDYKEMACHVLAEIMHEELKWYTNPSIKKLFEILSNPTPNETLTQAEIDTCFFHFNGKENHVKMIHKVFDNRIKEYEEYERQELDVKPEIQRSIYQDQVRAWEQAFDAEAKSKWRKYKGI